MELYRDILPVTPGQLHAACEETVAALHTKMAKKNVDSTIIDAFTTAARDYLVATKKFEATAVHVGAQQGDYHDRALAMYAYMQGELNVLQNAAELFSDPTVLGYIAQATTGSLQSSIGFANGMASIQASLLEEAEQGRRGHWKKCVVRHASGIGQHSCCTFHKSVEAARGLCHAVRR